ncbi:MAG: hypothetical protein K0U24_04530 [Gammaproteobacteria bacterium]|nr:hypothetical protein [Gammaproteobacteria bacterium]MCH9763482.1 hypothetical protein [Gammaproteobacteria bacterium]
MDNIRRSTPARSLNYEGADEGDSSSDGAVYDSSENESGSDADVDTLGRTCRYFNI